MLSTTLPSARISLMMAPGPSSRPLDAPGRLAVSSACEERGPRSFFSLYKAAKVGRLVLATPRVSGAPEFSCASPAVVPVATTTTTVAAAAQPRARLMTQDDPRVQRYIAALARWKEGGALPGRLAGAPRPAAHRKQRVSIASWVASAANVGAVLELDAAPSATEGMCVLALAALALWGHPSAAAFPALWAEGVWHQTAAVVQTVCYGLEPCPIAPPVCWLGTKEMRGYFNSHIKPRTPGYVPPPPKDQKTRAAKPSAEASEASTEPSAEPSSGRVLRHRKGADSGTSSQAKERAVTPEPAHSQDTTDEDDALPAAGASLAAKSERLTTPSLSQGRASSPIDVETIDSDTHRPARRSTRLSAAAAPRSNTTSVQDSTRARSTSAESTESGGTSGTAVESDETAVEPPSAKRKAGDVDAEAEMGDAKRTRVSVRARKPTALAMATAAAAAKAKATAGAAKRASPSARAAGRA